MADTLKKRFSGFGFDAFVKQAVTEKRDNYFLDFPSININFLVVNAN